MSILHEKARIVGEYKLLSIEELSPDGNEIRCVGCGKPKYVAEYSGLNGKRVWFLAGATKSMIGEGCDCLKASRKRKEIRRYEYESAEFSQGKDEDGKPVLTMTRGERNFTFDYSKYWMMESVPDWGIQAMLSDRFYQSHYTTAVDNIRTVLEEADVSGEFNNSFFFRGDAGSLKTSMLCCLRFKLLSNTIPTIMLSMYNLMRILMREEDKAGQLYTVDHLIIDDLGKATLNKAQEEKLANLVSYRKRASKQTSFGSLLRFDDLSRKGYSKELIDDIRTMDCDKEGRRSIAVVDLSDDSERVEF